MLDASSILDAAERAQASLNASSNADVAGNAGTASANIRASSTANSTGTAVHHTASTAVHHSLDPAFIAAATATHHAHLAAQAAEAAHIAAQEAATAAHASADTGPRVPTAVPAGAGAVPPGTRRYRHWEVMQEQVLDGQGHWVMREAWRHGRWVDPAGAAEIGNRSSELDGDRRRTGQGASGSSEVEADEGVREEEGDEMEE